VQNSLSSPSICNQCRREIAQPILNQTLCSNTHKSPNLESDFDFQIALDMDVCSFHCTDLALNLGSLKSKVYHCGR